MSADNEKKIAAIEAVKYIEENTIVGVVVIYFVTIVLNIGRFFPI